jgi:hypothetical protein
MGASVRDKDAFYPLLEPKRANGDFMQARLQVRQPRPDLRERPIASKTFSQMGRSPPVRSNVTAVTRKMREARHMAFKASGIVFRKLALESLASDQLFSKRSRWPDFLSMFKRCARCETAVSLG